MTWTVPMTAVNGQVLSFRDWNDQIRDNMNESMAAKAHKSGGWFVADDAHSVAQRYTVSDYIQPNEATTSTDWTDLHTPGPMVRITADNGVARGALCFLSVRFHIDAAGTVANAGLAFIDEHGNVTLPSTDASVIYLSDNATARIRMGIMWRATFPNRPGTIKVMYRRPVGTGLCTFSHRKLTVLPTK